MATAAETVQSYAKIAPTIARRATQFGDQRAFQLAVADVGPQYREKLEDHLSVYGLGAKSIYRQQGSKGYFVYNAKKGKWINITKAEARKRGFSPYEIGASVILNKGDFRKYSVGGSEQRNHDFIRDDLLQTAKNERASQRQDFIDTRDRAILDYDQEQAYEQALRDAYISEWEYQQPRRQEAIGAQAADVGLYNSGQRQESQYEDSRTQQLERTGYERDWDYKANERLKSKDRTVADARRKWQEYLLTYKGDVARAKEAWRYDTNQTRVNQQKNEREWFTNYQNAIVGNVNNRRSGVYGDRMWTIDNQDTYNYG